MASEISVIPDILGGEPGAGGLDENGPTQLVGVKHSREGEPEPRILKGPRHI